MDGDKFIWAMMVLIVALIILMGGGFAFTEYLKENPAAFQPKPQQTQPHK